MLERVPIRCSQQFCSYRLTRAIDTARTAFEAVRPAIETDVNVRRAIGAAFDARRNNVRIICIYGNNKPHHMDSERLASQPTTKLFTAHRFSFNLDDATKSTDDAFVGIVDNFSAAR